MNREPRFPSRSKGHEAPPTAPRHAGGFRRWWWLACAGWLITLATPAQVVKLLDYNNAVRFNHTDNLDGVAWTARAFDDFAWPSGPGLLAFEDNASIVPLIRTVLPSPVNLTPAGHAVYFRAHFYYPSDRPAILTLSNYVDDGAVFYLNGTEMKRVRVTANPVNHLTLATSSITESTVDVFESAVTNLVAGENVLAVSVHQNSTTSGDIVFGSTIWAEVIDPINIAEQPQDQVVQLNQSFAFSMAATGTLPSYQWQFMATNSGDFVNIGTATYPTYSQTWAAVGQAGSFRCIVTNLISAVTSQVATLTLLPDLVPPRLLGAIASDTTNNIIATLSEPVLFATATNPNNYRITELGGTNVMVVTNVQVNNSQGRVRLWTVQRWQGVPPRDYLLTVNNLADTATNPIAPDTRIGIAFWRPAVPMNAFWNWCEDFDLTGQDWTSPAYNEATNEWYSGGQWIIPDQNWDPVGRALFYFPVAPLGGYTVSGGPLNTVLTFGRTTYYFRTRFVLPPNTSSAGVIKFGYLVDDGAVFHLNGVEVMRVSVPPGPLAYATLASGQRGSFAYAQSSQDLTVTNLMGGTNILAVELKPASTLPFVEYGICFGAEVSVASAPTVPPAGLPLLPVPLLEIARAGDGGIVLRWEAPCCVLQTKTRVEDTWSDLPGVTSPFTNAVNATRFFRLRCP